LDGFVQTLQDLFGGQVAILEIFLKQAVFAFSRGFHQLCASFICFSFETGWNFSCFLTFAFIGFHRNQVNHALKIVFLAHR